MDDIRGRMPLTTRRLYSILEQHTVRCSGRQFDSVGRRNTLSRTKTAQSRIAVTHRVPIVEQIKTSVLRQIAQGIYKEGDRLPSIRQLARDLGVNPNTVSKAYSELSQSHVVESVTGKGVFVKQSVISVDPENVPLPREAQVVIEETIERFFNEGYSGESIKHAFIMALDKIIRSRQPMVALVECTPQDTAYLAKELSSKLGLPVTPVLVSDLGATVQPEEFDVFVTTLFHFQAVKEIAGECNMVFPVNIAPAPDLLLTISRLKKESTVLVMATDPDTVDSLKSVVDLCHSGQVVGCLSEDINRIREALRVAKVVIHSASCCDVIKGLQPKQPTIEVAFHILDDSVRMIGAEIKKLWPHLEVVS